MERLQASVDAQTQLFRQQAAGHPAFKFHGSNVMQARDDNLVGMTRRALSDDSCGNDNPALLVNGVCTVTDDLTVGHRSLSDTFQSVDANIARLRDITGWVCAIDPLAVATRYFDSKAAYDWEHFVIGGVHHIAVAMCTDSYEAESPIYSYNDLKGDFEVTQEIQTKCAVDIEHFTIGDKDFLMVVNWSDGYSIIIDSVLLRYNTSSMSFEEHQRIETDAARGCTHYFTMGDTHYLAIAHVYDHLDTSYQSTSVVLFYNTSSDMFELFQGFATQGAHDWEHFTMNGTHYLAVANHRNAATFNVASVIYRYNDASGLFETVQLLPTVGGYEWEYFRIGNKDFLAIANAYFDAEVFVYNNNTAKFESVQEIPVTALDWAHFEMGGSHYLAAANHNDDPSVYDMSALYRYEPVSEAFQLVQEFDTYYARRWEHFVMDGVPYLIIANGQPDSQSVLYRLNSAC